MSKRHLNAGMARTELFLKDVGRALNAAEDWAGPAFQRGGAVRPLRPKGSASLYRLPAFVGLQKNAPEETVCVLRELKLPSARSAEERRPFSA